MYIRGPWEQGLLDRIERFRQNFRADLHYQENVDWETKNTRDSLRSFIAKQIQDHGSFEAAVKSYSDKTGQTAPIFVVDDVVLDYTLKRVGVTVAGPDEPNFLHDGNLTAVDGVQKSMEGYVIFVTGLNQETQEDDLFDHFSEFGKITDTKFALERRSGFCKGYALVEYKTLNEAEQAIREGNGSELCEQTINVAWAFAPAPAKR